MNAGPTGGRSKCTGSIRQPPALRAMKRIVFSTSRRSTAGLRPRRDGFGSIGSIRAHSSSVRSEG
jgi:hypothetical protein